MAEGEEEQTSIVTKLFVKHIKYVYGFLLALGLYLIFIEKDYLIGVPLTIVMAILLSIPAPKTQSNDSAVVAWNEFINQPDGVIVNRMPFNTAFPIDRNASNFADKRIFRRGNIYASKMYRLYEVLTQNSNPIVIILRRTTKLVDGSMQMRFVETHDSVKAALMAHSDMLWRLDENEKSDLDPEAEFAKRFMKMNLRKKSSLRRTITNAPPEYTTQPEG